MDGVPWLDEIERSLRPGSHVLIRINPRRDLPEEEFIFVQGETTPFAVTHYPMRTIYTTIAFHPPWTIPADKILDEYNGQTWFLHDLGRSTADWWTIWRHKHGTDTLVAWIQTPTRPEAWKTLDAVVREWPDLAIALWELVEPHQYWKQAPTLRYNDFLVLILDDIDTPKDDSLIICEFLPTLIPWLRNVPRVVTYDEACQFFWQDGMRVEQFHFGQLWLNGVLRHREAGDLRLDHGDILSFSCPPDVHLWPYEEVQVQEDHVSHETPASSADGAVSTSRTVSTGPMSNIATVPDPPDHAFQPDYHFNGTSAVVTFSFTEEFADAIRLRRGSVAPFPNFFGRRGADLPDEEEEPPRRSDEDNRRLRRSTSVVPVGISTLCVRYAAEGLGDLYGHITFQPHDPPDEWIRAVEFVWPALRYKAWHFVTVHDPIRDSHVIRPSVDALLIAVQTEGRWPRVRVAFEVDKLDRTLRNRVQELTQQQVPTVVNRIQLIAFSDFSDLCDPTRNERCFHCHMYLNGVVLLDEDMQAVREGDHPLLRIIPRLDLPVAFFANIPVSATGFDEQGFPRRVVHNSLDPTAPPWNISPNAALDTYCISLWTNHGGAVLTQRWFTVWRVRSLVYHRVPSMRVRRVHPQDAWIMIDKIHTQWPDLQPREWSLMQVHASYLLSVDLARHAQLVILQTPIDTPHNHATVVLHKEGVDAWAGNLPRRVSILQLTGAFGFTDAIPPSRFRRNGIPLEPGHGLYDAFHGDVFTLVPENLLGVTTIVGPNPQGEDRDPSSHERGHPYHPYRNRGPTRDYGGYSRSGASSSSMRPTDSIATSNAYPIERDSMPLRTFQQMDAQPVTHSFTDEFLRRWQEIVTARQNGAPLAPNQSPADLTNDPDTDPWGAARISRTQVLRPLRIGWNTIWRRHQRHGADVHHPGDPLDHLELHLIPHLTYIFALIFAYWPDLRPDNQWFLSTADESIQYARRARPFRGELFFLNSVLDGRPGHQIVAFELPDPDPLVVRYVPAETTFQEVRHHLQALPEEHVFLNGIPWSERDAIELSNGDFLCARLHQAVETPFGNDIAVNFRISRAATTQDAIQSLGNQPRSGYGGLYPTDRPTHPPTPHGSDSEQDQANAVLGKVVYQWHGWEGNKTVTFEDDVDLILFDDDAGDAMRITWDPEVLHLCTDPFPLPELPELLQEVDVTPLARTAPNTVAILDMATDFWSEWAWEQEFEPFQWQGGGVRQQETTISAKMPSGHIVDLHSVLLETDWASFIDTRTPVACDEYWLHPNTICALPFITSPLSSPPKSLVLYTDGSYQPAGLLSGDKSAAWSVVVLVQSQDDTLHYWGHLAAACDASSAFEAEVDAMVVALLFAYHVASWQELQIELSFDCTSADFVASFPSKAATRFPTSVLRGLSQAVRQRTIMQTRHVPGHRGDPFNELANTFANAARSHALHCPAALEALFDILQADPWAAQWLWLVANPTQAGFVSNPEEDMYDIVTPELPTTLTQINFEKGRGLTSDGGRNSETTLASFGSLSLGLATHNVLTLNDFSKNGRRIPPQPSARTLHLEQQWGQQQCHLVGLQETRAYKEQCVACKNGFLFLTPSDHGTGGCGLYVDTKHSYGTNLDGDLYFSRKHFTIIATEAETLIVKVKAVDFSAIIVVAHAPSADKGPALREQYWQHVTELLRPHRQCTLLLFADANDELLPAAQPSAFADFLHRHRLSTPALHAACHSGASWTHTSAKGQLKKRLDYVAVPQAWEETDYMESRVAYDADVAITREDHELVTLHTRRHGDGSRPATFRIVLPYDNPQNPTAAAHAFWRKRLQDGLKWLGYLPDFQAHASVDQHAMALQHSLLYEAKQVYPKKVAPAKKPYVSAETMTLIKQRGTLRRQKRQLQQELDGQALRFFFRIWSSKGGIFPSLSSTVDHNMASIIRAFDLVCYRLRGQLAQDKRWYFETLAGEIPRDSQEIDLNMNKLWPKLKFALPKQACKVAKTLPREQMTGDALQHFAAIEEGRQCNRDLLWRWHVEGLKPNEEVDILPLEFLPTLAEVEGVLAGFKHYKSPGEDLLTADLLQAGGTEAARWILPLVVKCFATGHLPLVFQGATLIPLYKGKGPADALASYRSIVLAPTLAKIVQALLRRRLLPHVLPHFGPFQLGGKPKGQVAFCTQAVRSFLNVARHLGRPAAVLFIDVKQAFYSLPRHHAVGPYLQPDEYQWLMDALDRGEECRQRCRGATLGARPPALSDVPPRIMTLLQNLVRHGWLVDQHDDQCAMTITGTRPGLPLADLLFNVAMIEVLRKVSEDLGSHGITTTLHCPHESLTQEAFPPVAWQDDVALVLDADDNETLRTRITLAVEIVLHRFGEAHMTVNFAKGKTELIAVYRGLGATQHQRHDIVDEQGAFHLPDGNPSVVTVARYQHLGSLIQGDAEMDAEVMARIAMAQDALRLLRRGAYRVQGLSQACRLVLLEALIFSRLFYNSATWVVIHRPAWKALQQFYHRAVRTAMRMPVKDATAETNQVALRKAEMPDLATQLRLRRLQHLGHLAFSGPEALLRVLETEETVTTQSWGSLVTEDLAWLRRLGGDFATLAPIYTSGMAWISWIQAHRSYWKGWLKRAKRMSISLTNQASDVQWFRRQMRHVLPACGVAFEAAVTTTGAAFACPECGEFYSDQAALASHRHLKHGKRSAHALYCSGTVCPVCLYECFSTERLMWHMKQSNARRPCLQWARANLLPEEQVQRVPLPVHLAGPRLPTLAERVASDALGRYASLPFQPQSDEQLDQAQQEEIPSQAASGHRCLSRVAHADIDAWCQQCVTAGEWEDPWVEDFADDYRTCCFSADFTTVLDVVTATDEVELITECEQWGQRVDKKLRELGLLSPRDQTRRTTHPAPAEPPARPTHPSRPGHLTTPLFEAWTHPAETIRLCQAEDADTQVQLGVQGPLPLDPRCGILLDVATYYILHLFSGHSREGDLDWWAQKLTVGGEYRVVTIPFDLVHHRDKGDLTNDATFKLLLDLLRGGRILAIQAGPPCETWSCARHQPVEDGRHAPRPLRSSQYLWGIPELTMREQLQVEIGNLLYQRTLVLVAWAIVLFVSVLVEHPAEPSDPGYASTWRLPQTRWLLRAPGVLRLRLKQWEWGQMAIKPTDFLVAHLPTLRRRLGETKMARCDRPPLIAGGTRGRDTSGAWKTSPLKVYPSALCHAFAAAFVDRAAELHHGRARCEDDPEFVQWLASLGARGVQMGPDWHGVRA